ncbi:MAG: PQQ-binding-like beta-propeller repeat protein [Phycisphaerae bacterium]|jgi:outer membrane protein assembly factor BamB
MAPDKARNRGNAQAMAQAPRLMRNLLRYAEDVKAGTVAPIQIYTPPAGGDWNGPISGRVFRDDNGNGTQEIDEPGLAGVGVSDTIDLVLTAADGSYTLPNAANNAKLLYVCLPSGAAKSNTWWRKISANSTPGTDFVFALRPAVESNEFDFAQITDVHIGGSGTTPLMIAALADIAGLKNPPAFILATGDLADVGSNLTHFEGYAAGAATSQVPLFNVFGNHDVNNSTNTNYRNYLGPDYYSFDYGDCHFLIVNSVIKPATQQNWITRDLQLLRGNKRLFIFQHYSPTDAEYAQFNSYGTEAVFSGHWHSHRATRAGDLSAFNTTTFIFGGIDCSPAGFRLLHVSATGGPLVTRTRFIADGKRLHVVSPSGALMISQGPLSIVVNAYETSAEFTAVSYKLKSGTETVAEGALTAQGDWNWVGTVPASLISRGAYDLEVTAVNDKGEVTSKTSSFMVMGSYAPAPAPTDNWPQFGGGPQRGGATATVLTPPLRLAWHRYTGGTLDFASPVVQDQAVYMGVKDRADFVNNGVLALSGLTGVPLWFRPTPAAVSHSVAVKGDRVYACSHEGTLRAFDRATGNEVWSRALGDSYQRFQFSGPVLADNKVFAGTYGYFGSFRETDGNVNWGQSYGADWISCNACPAVSPDGQRVIVPANWANNIRAVNAANGSTIWTYSVRGLHGSPVISGNYVVFTDYDGNLHCASLSSGAQIWSRALGGGRSASTPAVADGIVVTGGTGSIRGYNLADGALLWTTLIGTSAFKMAPYNNHFAALVGSPTISGQIAYVPCGDGRLYALDLQTGAVLWSLEVGAPLISAPCISGNMLYLSSYDGNVYAFSSGPGNVVTADFDGDLDVDMADFGHLQACLTPTGVLGVEPGCADANLNGDSVVNKDDVTRFIQCFSGPMLQPPDGCYIPAP